MKVVCLILCLLAKFFFVFNFCSLTMCLGVVSLYLFCLGFVELLEFMAWSACQITPTFGYLEVCLLFFNQILPFCISGFLLTNYHTYKYNFSIFGALWDVIILQRKFTFFCWQLTKVRLDYLSGFPFPFGSSLQSSMSL